MQRIGKGEMIPDKWASLDEGRSPIDDHPELLLDEHIPLLKSAIWVIVVGATVFALLLLALPVDSLRRIYATLALVALAASALVVLRHAGAAAAVRLLAIGGWLLVTAASVVGEGVRTPILLSYPVVLMFSGWLLGARYCLVLFAMSCLAVIAMALGEHSGAITAATPVPPLIMAVAHLIVLSVSAVMTLYLLRVFRQRYAAELRLNAVLQSSESRFRNLLQSVPTVAVQGYGEDGTARYWNQASERLYGYSAEEAIGRNLLELIIPPEMCDGVRAAMRQMFESGQPIPAGELSLMRKDGSRADVFSCHAYVHVPGQAPEMFCLDIDLSERKRMEDALLIKDAIVEASLNGIALSDLQGRLTYVNAAFCKMWGIPSSAAIGRPAVEFWRSREDPEKVMDAVLQQSLWTGEMEATRPDGQVFSAMVAASLVRNRAGDAIGMMGAFTDITEFKQAEAERARLEAQLRESQKMEALGTMAGGVAHDFNNALAAILGNVELAREDVGPAHPALVSLEEIGKASRRAKALVQQILAFGRRQKMERKPMSLALVVVETARLIRASIPAMLTLNVNCEADTPAVLADATQIEQILLNLCSNAAHAVEDIGRPGVIEINLSACERADANAFGDLGPRRYACLTVGDNGRGMDEATRSRIFEPFFTTKQAGKGTGLGLSVVHGLVQAHEASIEVESASGQGSTFRIYFPAIEAPAEAVLAPTPEATPAMGTGKHVLYLDDEEAIIFLMKRLLGRKGYRVSGYTDPGKALAAVRADPGQFDLAVTDYYMPGMSGLEVAQALKEIRPDLPIVMASGYVSEELRAKAPAAGVSKLIYKPNTVEDLCEAVARFANGQSGSNS
jgi:PAS domain S-box-containing protein